MNRLHNGRIAIRDRRIMLIPRKAAPQWRADHDEAWKGKARVHFTSFPRYPSIRCGRPLALKPRKNVRVKSKINDVTTP